MLTPNSGRRARCVVCETTCDGVMGPIVHDTPRVSELMRAVLTPQFGPEMSIKDTWSKLSVAIREIQNHNASKLSFEEHYRYAYNMVLFKRACSHTLNDGYGAVLVPTCQC